MEDIKSLLEKANKQALIVRRLTKILLRKAHDNRDFEKKLGDALEASREAWRKLDHAASLFDRLF